MGVKITLTIEPDTNYLKAGQAPEAMAKTIALLGSVVDVPATKVSVTIQCTETQAETIHEALCVALSGRPVGIFATMKTQTEEYIAVKREPTRTPMDDVLDSVELSHNGRTVTLTSETAEKAAAALRGLGEKYGATVEFGAIDGRE